MTSEIRAPRRETLSIMVQVKRSTDPVGVISRSINLSTAGMLIETELKLRMGETVFLRFIVPKTAYTISVEACVVREEPSHGVQKYGVRFVDLKPEDGEVIETFVSSRLK